ncbi:MAG TPA: ABC transporter permease [Bryobacteraceae bacterium]|nr:ABC transporter permease [Bryobacteraceae bacterium]
MLSKDLRYAFRMLRKTPVFAITGIITIGLGIGACTAIFSVTNTVLLRPLPYKAPDRLVLACNDLRQRNVKDFLFSNADFLDLRGSAKTAFEDFAAVIAGRRPIPQTDGTPEEIRFANVSTNFFRLMGASLAAGRDFADSDGTPQPVPPDGDGGAGAAAPAPQPPAFAILSYGYFERRFGGNRSAIGQTLKVPGGPDGIVVGVLSPGFELLFPPDSNIEQFPDIWFAARIPYDTANRNNVQWRVIGRMKPGVTLERAQAEADTVTEQLRRVSPIARTAGQYIRIEPMKQHLVNEVRPAVVALMGAVIFLLLIACANVANLMLVRGSLRERELAVRTALGGNRWQLIRQMLAEAVILAALGTILGVGLAWAGIRELVAIAPENLPRLDAIHIDGAVLAFSALAGLGASALFGIAPALRSARPDVISILRASGRTPGLGGGMLRNGVVVLEVALCFILLTGSGLMVRSFLAIQRVDVGFDPHNLLTFQVLGNQPNTPAGRAAFERQLRDRFAAIPGVRAVAAAFPMPLGGGFFPIRWGTDEALTDPTKFLAADFQVVLPGYFEAMHTPVIAGRTFTEADNTPDRNMLIIDQALALKAFPFQSAVGKRILFRARTPEPQWGEIVGVVAHQRDVSLSTPGREQIYVTDGYMNHGAAAWWALRTMGDPNGYVRRVRDEVRRFDPTLLVNLEQSMDSMVVKAQAGTRFSLLLIGLFAGIAALLAAVGLYGVLSTVVRQRTAEIGVRMAVGAPPARVFGLVVGYGLRLFATGIAIGLVAALEVTQSLKSMLIGVKPIDPATFFTMAALFFLLAAVVSWMPARRAAALDPVQALREE